jgi:hypothetical protein
MKKLILSSILAVAVMTISGCSSKCGVCAPSYPTCVAKPACGCK